MRESMIPRVDDYTPLVGKDVIAQLKKSAETLRGKHVVHVNATSTGGGVAEILNTLVYLMNDLGIVTGWRVLLGNHSFFQATKHLHNALQGRKGGLSQAEKNVYLEFCQRNALLNHLSTHDIVVVHDPQPLAMVTHYTKTTTWLWRCHIDLSNPDPATMAFLKPFIERYDAAIISNPKFRIKGVQQPQCVIPPSIDPLSEKNKPISRARARAILTAAGIPLDKPIIAMVSRFDPWKGHRGVLDMYRLIKKSVDCRLVFLGDMAADDPEGPGLYADIARRCARLPDVHVLTQKDDLLVNALQQESAFIFQNSVKEGFALTVAEALWKGTPVLGTPVGGIPLQVLDGKTGYLVTSVHQGAERAVRILKSAALRKRLGLAGREHVRQHFLITRHLQDYLDLFNCCTPQPDFNGLAINQRRKRLIHRPRPWRQ